MDSAAFVEAAEPAGRTARRPARLLLAIMLAVTLTGAFPAVSLAAEALALDKRNVIAAPRSGKLVMLLALQDHRAALRAMEPAAVEQILSETAKRYLTEAFGNARYREGFPNADVIFAFVDNMDEYNRPNFGGMRRIGSASFLHEAGAVKIQSVQIDMNLIRQ